MTDGKRLTGMVILVTLLGMIFAGSFLGALHSPKPHDVPVAVAAPANVVAGLNTALDQRAEGAFDLTAYPSESAARKALLNRDVDGVLVPGPSGNKLIVAGAAGRATAEMLTKVFQGASAGKPITVEDARPLPAGDGNGIGAMFFVITIAIPGVALAVMASVAAPRMKTVGRLAILAVGSAAIAGANTWVADGLIGALSGAPLALWGVGTLAVFAMAAATAGLVRLIGPAGAGLSALLFVPIGFPASGGPVGAGFIPQWYAAVGEVLPVSAAINAVRNVVYFDGNAINGRLLVLGIWAAAGLLLILLPRARGRAKLAAAPASAA